jgi:hypothetical protein
MHMPGLFSHFENNSDVYGNAAEWLPKAVKSHEMSSMVS